MPQTGVRPPTGSSGLTMAMVGKLGGWRPLLHQTAEPKMSARRKLGPESTWLRKDDASKVVGTLRRNPPVSGGAVALLLLEVFAFAYFQANSFQGSGSVLKVFLLQIHLR